MELKLKMKMGNQLMKQPQISLQNIIEKQNINKTDLDIFESDNNDHYCSDLLSEYIKSVRKIVDIEF